MTSPGRNKVVCVGTLGKSVLREIRNRYLDVTEVSFKQFLTTFSNEYTRAVLIVFDGNLGSLVKVLTRFAVPILDSGALLAVILPEKVTFKKDLASVSSVVRSISESQRFATVHSVSVRDPSLDIKTLKLWEPREIAHACFEHDPGPEPNAKLDIDPPNGLGTCPYPLLRRAFSEFSRVKVSRLMGGRSGATGVWRIDAHDMSNNHFEPFTVKAGDISDISDEIGSMTNLILNRVPFPFYPPVLGDRCVIGASQRLIVSRFIDRATRFDDYLETCSPALAISALFDGPLRTWRSPENQKLSTTPIQLAELYKEYRVIPDMVQASKLNIAYRLALGMKKGIDTPVSLLTRLYNVGRFKCKLCFAHGDLHLRNIFVRHNSLDVVLIDFAKVHESSPMSRDPATLDVALGFDVWDDAKPHIKPLSDRTLIKLYAPPLFSFTSSFDGHRVEAIRRVRLEARDTCEEREYKMSIACCLLRFARLGPPKGSRKVREINHLRGLAYLCADTLAKAI